MSTWADEFRNAPELGIMEQAYQKLRVQQPGLVAPSKPVKREISSDDRRKEDEELQMALALSIKDKGVASPSSNGGTSNVQEQHREQAPQAQAPAPQGTTAATVSRVRALYDFTPSEPGELAFRKDDIIAVLESVFKDWWKGSLRGQTGIFPLNYVEKLQDPTKDELERDAQMESEVFGEIKNVEKLLALLSVGGEGGGRRGEREEEEISELYQRTLSIRPKLIELIARYSQKKGEHEVRLTFMITPLIYGLDDFTQLNEKFIKARRDYEALLESSMSQPQYHQQQYPVRARPQPPYQHQQPPYGGPQHQPAPQGYPPQAPSSAQGYQQPPPFSPPSQQHIPPQQDPQRFFSPAPSDVSQYPQHNAPHPPQGNGAAPFHFIPGGMGPPPASDIRRKPSPHGPPGPQDSFHPAQAFQGQIRPNSIHTLNSGNPQELATSGYESPIDNRQSYPPAQMQQPPQEQQVYNAYPPRQPHQQQAPPSQAQQAPPARQLTDSSIDSPTSMYSTQQPDSQYPQQAPQQQQPSGHAPPQQPSAPPPGVPSEPGLPPAAGGGQAPQAPYKAYQAYQQPPPPSQQQQQQQQQQAPPAPRVGGDAGDDPGDFYR